MTHPFEQRVLDVVNGVIGDNEHAEFVNGTLFVKVGALRDMVIIDRALAAAGCGKTQVNWVGDEYAVDFV